MSKHNLDSRALGTIICSIEEQIVFDEVYKWFRDPFVRFFYKQFDIQDTEGLSLLGKVFPTFFDTIRQGASAEYHDEKLLRNLILLGINHKKEGPLDTGVIRALSRFVRNEYQEANVIISLLELEVNDALECVRSAFRQPMINMIKGKISSNESPDEVMDDALLSMRNNILHGKLKLPMRSMLSTYVYRIAMNKYLDFLKNINPNAEQDWPDEIFEEDRLLSKPEEEKTSYFEQMLERKESLDRFAISDQNTFIDFLLDKIGDPCKSVLELRYLEEHSYKEIGVLLVISEEAARKRHFDCIQRLRRLIVP